MGCKKANLEVQGLRSRETMRLGCPVAHRSVVVHSVPQNVFPALVHHCGTGVKLAQVA